MEYNTELLDTFFESDSWEHICHQAIEEGDEHAKELMKTLSVCLDSFYFFLERDEQARATRELKLLTEIINIANEI